jgi:CBS domain-containing protein
MPPRPPRSWARHSLDADPDALLGSIERGLRVRLIATPCDELVTCDAEADLRAEAARNEDRRFDFLPVTRAGDGGRRICGLMRMVSFLEGHHAPEGAVSNYMEPLSEENLIGADAGILTFIRHADSRPCRLVFAGTRIVGLVSLSDIQRLPVRPVLFMLITHFELLMADIIRIRFKTQDVWKELLSKDQRRRLDKRIADRRRDGMEIDPLLMTEFSEKTTIVGKIITLSDDQDLFKSDMDTARRFRNDLAHAKNFAATREDAEQTCKTVRSIEKWIGRLRCPPFVLGEESFNAPQHEQLGEVLPS